MSIVSREARATWHVHYFISIMLREFRATQTSLLPHKTTFLLTKFTRFICFSLDYSTILYSKSTSGNIGRIFISEATLQWHSGKNSSKIRLRIPLDVILSKVSPVQRTELQDIGIIMKIIILLIEWLEAYSKKSQNFRFYIKRKRT